jgi:hypothetical protein
MKTRRKFRSAWAEILHLRMQLLELIYERGDREGSRKYCALISKSSLTRKILTT